MPHDLKGTTVIVVLVGSAVAGVILLRSGAPKGTAFTFLALGASLMSLDAPHGWMLDASAWAEHTIAGWMS
ncbi:hypothetical protein BX265_2325 [Streptomyces sp. TLI_235]|nr:hypothetical protein [Streptomyces sp. TLI_235]PBC77574.1 hypothetical protein BX265_2325 [Streptomyces sp. TLI_235]